MPLVTELNLTHGRWNFRALQRHARFNFSISHDKLYGWVFLLKYNKTKTFRRSSARTFSNTSNEHIKFKFIRFRCERKASESLKGGKICFGGNAIKIRMCRLVSLETREMLVAWAPLQLSPFLSRKIPSANRHLFLDSIKARAALSRNILESVLFQIAVGKKWIRWLHSLCYPWIVKHEIAELRNAFHIERSSVPIASSPNKKLK